MCVVLCVHVCVSEPMPCILVFIFEYSCMTRISTGIVQHNGRAPCVVSF